MQGEKKQFTYNPTALYEHIDQGENASINFLKMFESEKEVCMIVQQSHLYSSKELEMLQETINKLINNRLKLLEKYLGFLFVLEKWMQLENRKKGLKVFLERNSIQKVAIYGYGYLGKQMVDYLNSKEIKVKKMGKVFLKCILLFVKAE
jgi:hypothetical protein